MVDDVTLHPTTVNANSTDLTTLAGRVHAALASAGHATTNLIGHLCDAGDALIAAKDARPKGWLKWLERECNMSADKAERYMCLARHRHELDSARARNLSLSAALRLIKGQPSPRARRNRKETTPPSLSTLAWSEASPEARRQFLDAIGLVDVLEAMPPDWRAELERCVLGGLAIRYPSAANQTALRKIEVLVGGPRR